jgi:hypothetical protein
LGTPTKVFLFLRDKKRSEEKKKLYYLAAGGGSHHASVSQHRHTLACASSLLTFFVHMELSHP